MPDESPVVLRAINWRETFPFTHVFRSFRVAIHPSKLILALLALLSLYVGGRILDGIWSPRHRGVPNEVRLYELSRAEQQTLAAEPLGPLTDVMQQANERAQTVRPGFADAKWAARQSIESAYARMLVGKKIDADGKPITQSQADEAAVTGKYLGRVKDQIKSDRDAAVDKLRDRRNKDKNYDVKTYDRDLRAAYTNAEAEWKEAKQVEGVGLWDLFLNYEVDQINGVVAGVTSNNWLGGWGPGESSSGVFPAIYRFFCVGPRWAFSQHAAYFTILGILFLIVWAIFGGAIARIAAVHVARDEKLSIREALRFSTGKFLSFVCAPVIPLVIILVVGAVVALGGLLLYIPVVGEFLVGLFFFLALAAGFVMTLVALGTLGGLNLMYPTVAVEGSDSFDAISRSFSYVYARPWRMLWYTMVSIAYGAITFLFVRLFIFLTLAFTRHFVGWWVVRHAHNGQYVWSAIYPGSSYWRLPYDVNFLSLSGGESIAAFLVAFWTYLVIGFLGAYVISYYFASSTIVYYLMRREVDATELDDVYHEQSDDEFAEPTVGPPPGSPSTAPAMGASATTTAAAPPASPPDKVIVVQTPDQSPPAAGGNEAPAAPAIPPQ